MRSSHILDRIDVAFDGTQLVAGAGLPLPATLAARPGLKELVERLLGPGRAAGRADAGDGFLTLVTSALAGGGCIDGAAALGAGGTANVLGSPSRPRPRWADAKKCLRVAAADRRVLAPDGVIYPHLSAVPTEWAQPYDPYAPVNRSTHRRPMA